MNKKINRQPRNTIIAGKSAGGQFAATERVTAEFHNSEALQHFYYNDEDLFKLRSATDQLNSHYGLDIVGEAQIKYVYDQMRNVNSFDHNILPHFEEFLNAMEKTNYHTERTEFSYLYSRSLINAGREHEVKDWYSVLVSAEATDGEREKALTYFKKNGVSESLISTNNSPPFSEQNIFDKAPYVPETVSEQIGYRLSISPFLEDEDRAELKGFYADLESKTDWNQQDHRSVTRLDAALIEANYTSESLELRALRNRRLLAEGNTDEVDWYSTLMSAESTEIERSMARQKLVGTSAPFKTMERVLETEQFERNNSNVLKS